MGDRDVGNSRVGIEWGVLACRVAIGSGREGVGVVEWG